MPFFVRRLLVFDEEQVHHQPNDFAGREVLSCGLVRRLSELPNQLLEDRPHDVVRHPVGVEVHVGEPRDHLEEQVRLIQLGDLLGELELLDDVARVGGEALDVRGQVRRDVIGSPFSFSKSSLLVL